jgi:hypothetical protein
MMSEYMQNLYSERTKIMKKVLWTNKLHMSQTGVLNKQTLHGSQTGALHGQQTLHISQNMWTERTTITKH